MNKIAIAGAAIIAGVALTTGSATASSLITSHQIKDGTVRSVDIKDGGVQEKDLSAGVQTKLNKSVTQIVKQGPAGPKGDTGSAGKDGTDGKNGTNGVNGTSGVVNGYFAEAKYDVGDTNGGAIATVACKNQTDVAISGGVLEVNVNKNVPVGSSFMGRMDWSTNTPKPGRTDGWIIQFATETGKAPEKVTLYAYCVPNAGSNVVNTYTESE